MRIPNFKTEEGAILYKDTVGKFIAPRVASIVMEMASQQITPDVVNVLDVACGPGTVSLALARKYPNLQITGVDSSAAMVGQCIQSAASEGLTNVHFEEMNANSIDFGDAKFDLIICNLAFPFFSRPVESMQGFRRALAEGGHVILSTPGNHTWEEFFAVAEDVLGDAVRMAKPFLIKIGQAEKLPPAMTEAGFQKLDISRHELPFEFSKGEDVLAFFQELFALLAYAPPEVQADLAGAIDERFPNGFMMHYEAVVVRADR